jgi:protein O-GlcNAc transferase
MPRAPSSSSTTASSAASGSSLLSVDTASTGLTRLSSFSSSGRPPSPGPKLDARPGPGPLQDPSLRLRQSDPGHASAAVQPRSAHGSSSSFVARRQTLPSETTAAFGRPRPFSLAQPPRSHRNSSPRNSPGRALWGRDGLPLRSFDTRHQPVPPNVPPSPYQASASQSVSRAAANHQLIDPYMQPALSHPHAPTPSPLASSLTRDALLTHARKLYENPAPGSRPPLGLTAQPLDPETTKPELVDPVQTYSAELLPLLTALRTLHPTHIPTSLLLACVQYAIKDYEASLRTNHQILALDANFVSRRNNLVATQTHAYIHGIGRGHVKYRHDPSRDGQCP